jgi:hypothetical protein
VFMVVHLKCTKLGYGPHHVILEKERASYFLT